MFSLQEHPPPQFVADKSLIGCIIIHLHVILCRVAWVIYTKNEKKDGNILFAYRQRIYYNIDSIMISDNMAFLR